MGRAWSPSAPTLTALLHDLSSFHNADIAQVKEDVQSGLIGETEPLRKYGILLTEAKVKQKGYRLGIAKS